MFGKSSHCKGLPISEPTWQPQPEAYTGTNGRELSSRQSHETRNSFPGMPRSMMSSDLGVVCGLRFDGAETTSFWLGHSCEPPLWEEREREEGVERKERLSACLVCSTWSHGLRMSCLLPSSSWGMRASLGTSHLTVPKWHLGLCCILCLQSKLAKALCPCLERACQ